jgi:hypothetical protein
LALVRRRLAVATQKHPKPRLTFENPKSEFFQEQEEGPFWRLAGEKVLLRDAVFVVFKREELQAALIQVERLVRPPVMALKRNNVVWIGRKI